MCSDCVFWKSLHDPLSQTLALLLRLGAPRTRAIVSFVLRERKDMEFVEKAIPSAGLVAKPVRFNDFEMNRWILMDI